VKKHYHINDIYSIKQITVLNDFQKLRGIWDTLAHKQAPYMTFLSFDWFHLWLNHFLKNNRLLILLLYKSDEIVTIAPFLIKQEKFKGIQVEKIEIIGNAYSPIRYFLFNDWRNEERRKNLSFILHFFVNFFEDWDILDLNSIPEEDNCFDVLKIAIERTQLKHSEYFCFGDWYTGEIKCTGDEYIANLPKKIRKDVPYSRRRLQKIGDLQFKLINNDDFTDYYMDSYYYVYSKSWQKREGIGPNFHRNLAKVAVKNDWLRLGFLFLDQSPIASQFWITCNNTSYILKTVYDQEYKKFSPGKILTVDMMKYMIDIDKVKLIDYVQGDEPYKRDWTPKRRERKGIIVYANNMKGQVLALVNNRILPALNNNKYLKRIKEIVADRVRSHPEMNE
jgi:CelD/BcsL family acetyltransferase involved in cellulose biosynthesis